MRWGVTYAALLANMVITMEMFLLSRNLLALLFCVPVHGLCVLLCQRDARYFDLLLLWMRTRLPSLLGNQRLWQCCSYSPLPVVLPDQHGARRSGRVIVQVWTRPRAVAP
jgi:type IV secretion system protein VirB3